MTGLSRQPPPDTLQELFDRHLIQLNEYPVAGRQHGGPRSKLFCPSCQGGKQRERNFFVSIDRDMMGATWHCFRASCGFSGGGRLKDAPERPQRAPRFYRKPEPVPNPERSDAMIEYFRGFGIEPATLAALGIYRTLRAMPVLDKDGKQIPDKTRMMPVIAYPYVDDGELVNVKYKAVYASGNKRFTQEAGTKRSLFNIDSFTEFGPKDFGIFVEGEDDVLALWQAGYRQVTTLPDGSPTKVSETYDRHADDDRRYEALHGEPRLDRLPTVILAGDMDEAGRRHHEEIARRIGKARCKVVRWPDGCKDAKDTLRTRGVEAVQHAIENAEFFPLEGVVVPDDEMLLRLYHGIRDKRIRSGIHQIDDLFTLSEAGSLIVTTGISGRGKTTFWNAMMVALVEQREEEMRADWALRPYHCVIMSPEMRVDEMAADLMAARAKQPFHLHKLIDRIPETEVTAQHNPWIKKHFTFIQWKDRGSQPPLSWAFERVRENVIRTGAQLAIMDPWQEFDDEIPDGYRGTTSKWVGKRVQEAMGMVDELKVNLVLVTHPTKMRKISGDESDRAPDGDDIAESVHFKSRCDVGLTIHRPKLETDTMKAIVWKSRNSRFSRYGSVEMRLDPATKRLFPRLQEVSGPVERPSRAWRDADEGQAWNEANDG